MENGGGIRNDAVLRTGPVTVGDTWDIAPFGNTVVVGEVPREAFRALLEQAVDRAPRAAGHFAQVSGFSLAYDPSAAAREIDRAGDCSVVGHPGGRVRDVVLDDGTVIVADGEVVPGGPVTLATVDFLAGGGDCYPLAGIEFTKLGLTDQQALARYISDGLGGVIAADRYPEGGGARITALGPGSSVTAAPGVTVAPGDSLWRIAAANLGAGARWRQIFSLNAGRVQSDGRRLTDPNLILVGWVLELPPG